MAAKYNFSATRINRLKHYQEEFQVVNCDSFEEARRIVEKAIHDRELQENEEIAKLPQAGLVGAPTVLRGPSPALTPQVSPPASPVGENEPAENPQS